MDEWARSKDLQEPRLETRLAALMPDVESKHGFDCNVSDPGPLRPPLSDSYYVCLP